MNSNYKETTKALKIHQPCPDCGSSDALCIYQDHTFCFACQTRKWLDEHKEGDLSIDIKEVQSQWSRTETTSDDVDKKTTKVSFKGSEFTPLKSRGITLETAKFYGVTTVPEKNYHVYPYYDKDTKELVAAKIRNETTKKFKCKGNLNKAGLFGMHLFSRGGRYLVITEGEVDAMSAYQMLAYKTPCVSVKNGVTSITNLKECYEYIDSFENIILCFDNDEAGDLLKSQAISLFSPLKLKVMNLGNYKDAGEFLANKKSTEFVNSFWRAEKVHIDGVVDAFDLIEEAIDQKHLVGLPLPWEGLMNKTRGIRKGETWVLCAGSGVGKSTVMKEIIFHLIENTNEKFGLFFMEETNEDTVRDFIGLRSSSNLRYAEALAGENKEKLISIGKELLPAGRVYLLGKEFGASSYDKIFDKIRYMNKALGVEVFVVDHITLLASDSDAAKERKLLDKISSTLADMAAELNIAIIMASQLARNPKDPHEEGGRISLKDLKGSGGIAESAHFVFGIERNTQDDNAKAIKDGFNSETVKIRLVKNRKFGDNGLACILSYDKNTGRMKEVKEDHYIESLRDKEEENDISEFKNTNSTGVLSGEPDEYFDF